MKRKKKDVSKKWFWILGILVVIIIFVLLFLSYFPLEQISCVWERDCPEGYQCYSILSGGLSLEGPIPVEPIGGDLLCHKSCKTSSDCPIFQSCKLIERCREDYCETIHLCFPWLSPVPEATPPWAD